MKTADTQYDLSLGDQAAVDLWDKYIEAHNNQDLEVSTSTLENFKIDKTSKN